MKRSKKCELLDDFELVLWHNQAYERVYFMISVLLNLKQAYAMHVFNIKGLVIGWVQHACHKADPESVADMQPIQLGNNCGKKCQYYVYVKLEN